MKSNPPFPPSDEAEFLRREGERSRNLSMAERCAIFRDLEKRGRALVGDANYFRPDPEDADLGLRWRDPLYAMRSRNPGPAASSRSKDEDGFPNS